MKNCYILFLFLFSNIFLFAQSFTTIPGTDGLSKATAYQIWTNGHLMELGDSINSKHPPYYLSWSADKHFKLMQDINDPITRSIGQTSFLGHFHGNGKKITVAITPSYYTPPYSSASVFVELSYNASIDSLTIDGYINYSADEGAVGIVITVGAGYNSSGIVSNCINNINTNIAGITQHNQGTIINCINNGDITGVDRIGGIAGENSGQIINCINTGKITATNSGTNADPLGNLTPDNGVGGIVGYINNACTGIINCINLGNIEGQGRVGGIIGTALGHFMYPTQITNCVNYGYIKGTSAVGGIAGIMWGGIYANVNISNCVNAGVVEGESDVGSITGKE